MKLSYSIKLASFQYIVLFCEISFFTNHCSKNEEHRRRYIVPSWNNDSVFHRQALNVHYTAHAVLLRRLLGKSDKHTTEGATEIAFASEECVCMCVCVHVF